MSTDVPSLDRVAALLTGALGDGVQVQGSEHLAPWSVLRLRLEPSSTDADTPRSVIVKWLRRDPRGLRADPLQLATEQAALEFLAEIEFPYAPRLIAADREAGILVMEDLAPRTALADIIRRVGAEEASVERRAFARAMGALNAATAGKSAAYDAVRSRYGAVDALIGRSRGLGADWPGARARLEGLGLSLSVEVERDLTRVLEGLLEPGPFLAFSNGDPEENNFLTELGDGRLIDFEFGAYHHALTCARWIHVPGPAWMTVTDALSLELEDEYRRALSLGIVEASDDKLFGTGMAIACLAFACDRLGRFTTLDERDPFDPSRAQMISTLESAARAARRHRALPNLAGWLERVAHALRRRWPDADVDFSSYQAYASR